MKILPILSLFILLSSCSKDDVKPLPDPLLIGIWESKNSNGDREYIFSYEFKEDGSYFGSWKVSEVSTGVILGFKSFEEGTFQTHNDLLELQLQEYKTSAGEDFKDLED